MAVSKCSQATNPLGWRNKSVTAHPDDDVHTPGMLTSTPFMTLVIDDSTAAQSDNIKPFTDDEKRIQENSLGKKKKEQMLRSPGNPVPP